MSAVKIDRCRNYCDRLVRRRWLRGYTLVETAISMSILSTVLLSVNLFMKPITDVWSVKVFSDDSQQESRLALLRMVRELSQIKDPASVFIAESHRIQFQNTASQTVTYRLEGAQILRNNRTLAKNIAEFTLTYWDQDHLTLSAPVVNPLDTNIYRISALIRTDRGGHSVTARSQVRPRNLYG